MIRLNVIISVTILLTTLISCEKSVEDDIIIIPPIPSPCVVDENITSQEESFYVWETSPQIKGSSQAIKLNKVWESSAASNFNSTSSTLHIILRTVTETDHPILKLREELTMSFNNISTGCYDVIREGDVIENNTIRVDYTTLNVDVIEDLYFLDLDDELESKVEIDSIDLENNFISGRYMLSFKADYEKDPNRESYNPDYIRFLNGSFSCQIDE